MSVRSEFAAAASEIFDSFGDLIKLGIVRKKGEASFDRDKGTTVRKDDQVMDARYVPDKPSKTFISKNGAAITQYGCYLVLGSTLDYPPVAGDQFTTADEVTRPIYEVETDDADAGIFFRLYIKL